MPAFGQPWCLSGPNGGNEVSLYIKRSLSINSFPCLINNYNPYIMFIGILWLFTSGTTRLRNRLLLTIMTTITIYNCLELR